MNAQASQELWQAERKANMKTKTEWCIEHPYGEPGTYVSDRETTELVAHVHGDTLARIEANAWKIVAVPQMIAALEMCVQHMQDSMSEAESLEHALDGHDGQTCCLCAAREALELAQIHG